MSLGILHLFRRNNKYRSLLTSVNKKSVLATNQPPTKVVDREKKISVDKATVEHLERLSLVDFGNEEGVKILEEAIAFAEQLQEIDTTNVEPLVSVLDKRCLRLREDVVIEGGSCKDVLKNASVTEEDYFVSPPGNVPLDRNKK